MWHSHRAAVEAPVALSRESDLRKDHLIFDTSSQQGRRELSKEAIAAINGDAKLRERLSKADGRRANELKRMIEHYQTLIGRHNGNIIATIQTGAEGQERLDLAGKATQDMVKRLKDFSSNAARLRGYVEELRKATRPLELVEGNIVRGIGCLEALSALVLNVRRLQDQHIATSSKAEYYRQTRDCVAACKEAWSKLQVAGKHPKLVVVRKGMKDAFATIAVNCRSEFKAAQQAVAKEHGQHVDKEVLESAAATCLALDEELVREIVDGYVASTAYHFYVQWAPNDVAPDAVWTSSQFEQAIERIVSFVVCKEPEIDVLFPRDWGVSRELLRKILREAEQTLSLKLAEFEGLRLKLNYYELTKMESIAKEFEQEADNRWNLSRPGADDEQVEKVDHCLSRRFVEFFRSHPDLSSQQSSLNASKHDGEGDKTGANSQETQDGQEGSKMIFAVFTLDELDDNIQDKDEQRDVLMVEEEIDDGGDYIALDRWSKGLKILQTDLSLWAVETLLLSTELGAGMTSFGQLDHDRSGLRTVMVNMEISRRGHKTILQMLDAPNRQADVRSAGKQAGKHLPANKDTASEGVGRADQLDKHTIVRPFSLRYRLSLVLAHREEYWQDFAVFDQTISFRAWRSSQLRLILSVVQMALKPGVRSEAGMTYDMGNEGAMLSEERWRVMEEAREFNSPQLLHAITRLTEEINQTEAPTSDLWNKYCEAHYARAARRLKNHVLSVIEKKPWVDNLGVLSMLMYDKLIDVGCFDPVSGSLTGTWGEVIGMLRTFREAMDLHENVQSSALCACLLRRFLACREPEILDVLKQELDKMLQWPDRLLIASALPSSHSLSFSSWYRRTAMEEMYASVQEVLSDLHRHFNNPLEEIPAVADVYAQLVRCRSVQLGERRQEALLDIPGEFSRCVRASVARRFLSLYSSRAQEDGQVDVEGCIDAVNELIEEVEIEAQHFAPAFDSHLSNARGISVLEFVRSCRQSVVESVGTFRTLNHQAVRLWRSLSDLEEKIANVLSDDMEEKRMALLELDSLSSMFERCVDNWLDEQTNRFAEMLHNCIQLERKNKWVALEQSGVSASVVDLFQMFHESLSQLFSIGVPLSKDQILSFVQQVDLFVMKYCNDVLTHHYKNKTFRMDPEALIPKFTVRRDALDKMADKMEEYFTAEGRLAAKGRREMNRAPKGEEVSMQQKMKKMFTTGKSNKQEGNKSDGNSQHARSKSDELDNKTSSHDKEDEVSDRFEKVERKLEKLFGGGGGGHHADPVELLPHKEERLQEQDLVGLCVRIKNLSWSKQQAISLEQDVKYLWGKERSRRQYLMLATQDEDGRNADDDLGDLLVNCQMALHHGQKTLIEYVATKIVFFDLREDFVGRLYFPSPSSYRLLPLLAQDGQLDSMLTEMSAEMLAVDGFSDLLWEILEKVCENIIRLLEWCLVGEQMGSIARHCDEKETGTIAEDLVSLKNYFVQRDEEGNSNGLDEEVVTSKTARLQLITNRILSEPSKSLIALFQDPHLPDDDDKDIMNRRIILGALDHRTDKAARDFVKEHRKKR